ncbi:MAG: DUF99 family protein, partial [Candidatus Micrarchaeota archaeon]
MDSPDLRILAIDDSPFSKKRGKTECIGVLSNGGNVEGIINFQVGTDGEDAAEKIIKAIMGSRFGK